MPVPLLLHPITPRRVPHPALCPSPCVCAPSPCLYANSHAPCALRQFPQPLLRLLCDNAP